MAAQYIYQNQPTLIQIAQDLVLGIGQSNPIFQYVFPIRNYPNDLKLRWQKKDNFSGLMKARGAGGPPTRIGAIGDTTYEADAGVFGEFSSIDEIRLLQLGAGPATTSDSAIRVDLQTEVAARQALLMARQQNRMRQMAWTLARTGTLSVALPGGGIAYSASVTIPTFTPTVSWSTVATATPLLDLMNLQPSYGRGTSNQFGFSSVAIANSVTWSKLYRNTNAADWGGQKGPNGSSVGSIGDYNRIRADRNLPEFITWDDGYLDDSGTFTMDIPDGEVLVVGKRPDNETPGQFMMTYNAVSKGAGAYTHIDDKANPGPRQEIPPRLDVHAGFNGGLAPMRMGQLVKIVAYTP